VVGVVVVVCHEYSNDGCCTDAVVAVAADTDDVADAGTDIAAAAVADSTATLPVVDNRKTGCESPPRTPPPHDCCSS